MNDVVINIYYLFEETNYGLKILFELSENYLYFNSSQFVFFDKISIKLSDEWKKLEYTDLSNKITISEFKEDELVSYFVKFSNDDIFYIYQKMDSLEEWSQDFEIVSFGNSLKYREVNDYMQESWIEKTTPINVAIPSIPFLSVV